MNRQVEVWLDYQGETILVGTLRSLGTGRRERASFEYASSYIANPVAYSIDPALPLNVGVFETAIGEKCSAQFRTLRPTNGVAD